MRRPHVVRFPARLFCVLLAAVLLLALPGCVGQTSPDPAESSPLPSADVSSPTPADVQPTISPDLFYANGRDVYVYSEPSDNVDNLLGIMKAGTTVIRLEEQDDFMRVRWNDGEVWCRSWYLAAEDPAVEAERDVARFERLSATPGCLLGSEPLTCYTTATKLNCRAEPNTSSAVLDQLPAGTAVTLYGQVKTFGLVRIPSGQLCFCSTYYLSGSALCAVYPGAIDLRALLPRARFEILFASSYNITGRSLYPAIPLLEKQTASMLFTAYQAFLDDGYILKIYDAYRPMSAQVALYDIVQDPRYIADPNNWGSWHQRGRAVDISLVDMATGEELEMPTPMHTFNSSAARSRRSSWSEEAQKNVDYMTDVMTKAGFSTISSEWWHFEYNGDGYMLPVEIDYDSLSYLPASEYFN